MLAPVDRPPATVLAFAAALVPILFSYGGWQSANTVAEEMEDPVRALPRALVVGTLLVIVIYVAVNVVYLMTLTRDGVAATVTPAADTVRRLFGPRGDAWITAAIAISAFGFLDLSFLGPTRISYAMAQDGVFFRSLGAAPPALRHTAPRDPAPGVLVDRPGPHRNVRRAGGLGRLRGLDLLRPDRRRGDPASPPHSAVDAGAGVLSVARCSLDPGSLRRGGRVRGRRRRAVEPPSLGYRPSDDARGHPDLLRVARRREPAGGMSGSRAPYMEWSKTRPRPAIDLAGSNLLPCSLEDLPGAREAVDIEGESPEGYPPLLEAIARHHGVGADRVATAGGCSGATFLACAAILAPGDDVLVESPGYDPLPAAATLLGARVRTFERRFEEGYALDPDIVAAALTPATRLVMLSNPHNPSGALASPESLARLANLAEALGFTVLVDEVYRETVLEDRPDPAALRSDHVISTSSLTKAYGLASLRCGWSIASPELTLAIRRARDVVDVWSPMPADRISVVAFRHMDHLAARARAVIEANRATIAEFLRGPAGASRGAEPLDPRLPPPRGDRRRRALRREAFPRDGNGGRAGPLLRSSRALPHRLRRRSSALRRGLASIAGSSPGTPPAPLDKGFGGP